MLRKASFILQAGILIILSACCSKETVNNNLSADPHNGGITLTKGFSALIVADNIGRGRHITVRDNGDIYLALRTLNDGYGIAALRDTTNDGKADIIEYFGEMAGTGIQIHKGYLYFANDTCVLRYEFRGDELVPDQAPETIVYGFKRTNSHVAKSIAFDTENNMYVNIGAPSNACQVQDRTRNSPGMDPCPILEEFGGIWRYKDDVINQDSKKGTRYATGLRNCVAIDWNISNDHLYVVQHGRDQLSQLFPEYYDDNANAELPAEEFFMLEEGDDCGWPYCYYDNMKNKKVLAPEYGGDGDSIGICSLKKQPIMAFPAHTAPNDLFFYSGDMFPSRFKNGAFIAFHGSWNRAPEEQAGYYVVFVPMKDGLPSGNWEVFAGGFAGSEHIYSPGDAVHRPMGLAQGKDGSLYVSDSRRGTIWRIFYN